MNRIDDFIFRELTGEIEDGLLVSNFVQGDARIRGIESHVDLRLAPTLWA